MLKTSTSTIVHMKTSGACNKVFDQFIEDSTLNLPPSNINVLIQHLRPHGSPDLIRRHAIYRLHFLRLWIIPQSLHLKSFETN